MLLCKYQLIGIYYDRIDFARIVDNLEIREENFVENVIWKDYVK